MTYRLLAMRQLKVSPVFGDGKISISAGLD